jgi:hypothetical protein
VTAPAKPRTPGPARTWACFFAPAAAWFLYQQGLGAVVRLACRTAGPPHGVLLGGLALLVCAAAAGFAVPAARGEGGEPTARTRRFVARLTLGLAGVFALAIAYQTAATLLVPPCAR